MVLTEGECLAFSDNKLTFWRLVQNEREYAARK